MVRFLYFGNRLRKMCSFLQGNPLIPSLEKVRWHLINNDTLYFLSDFRGVIYFPMSKMQSLNFKRDQVQFFNLKIISYFHAMNILQYPRFCLRLYLEIEGIYRRKGHVSVFSTEA